MKKQIRNIVCNHCIATFAFAVLLTTCVSSFGEELCTFGKQNDLVLKNGNSGFSVPFEAENVFATQDASKFSCGQSGCPSLPQQTILLLLSLDADLSSVEVAVKETVARKLDGEWDIPPVSPPASSAGVSWPKNANIVDGKDMAVYGLDKDYPAAPVTSMFTGKIGEWKLVTVQICPYRYNPVTGSLSMIESGNLEVVYKQNDEKENIVGAKRWRVLAEESLNFDAVVGSYKSASAVSKPKSKLSAGVQSKSSGSSVADYLIFTTSAIRNNSSYLAYFITYKQALGFSVRVVTEGVTQDATHYLSGSTCDQRSDNMRAWLVANHVQLGIEYVLFIGNPHPTAWNTNNSIPMKKCYPAYSDGILYDCPTDMYYAELSGNWDKDGDNRYGEFNGDYGAGGIDKYCEIAVGRIPVYDTGSIQIGYLDSILQNSQL